MMVKVLKPRSELEIAEIVKRAKLENRRLEITGGGSRKGLGYSVMAHQNLCLTRHSGITLYEPEALTIVAKAGMPLKDIQKVLKNKGQQLPFEPMGHHHVFGTKENSTIGGVVACNISGPRRIQAGACRDSLIGVRFVDGNGDIIKNGGRVMKNVTGLDLVKLLCGSHGTLGVITEVAFKVLPIAEREVTLAIAGLPLEAGISTLASALGSPYEITGAAFLPDYQGKSLCAMRVQGFSDQVDYRLEKLQEMLGKNHDYNVIENRVHENFWHDIRDVKYFKNSGGSARPLWRISTKPGNAPAIYEKLTQLFEADYLFDWGGGLIWVQPDQEALNTGMKIRDCLAEFGGHATLIRMPDNSNETTAIFQPQSKRIMQLSQSIRCKFDPASILNSGRMMQGSN